jgi:hypothetical protein
MKLRAFLLVAMVLFFTVQPILLCCQLETKVVEEMACCSSEEEQCPIATTKGCKQEDNPCNSSSNTCNPFASCSQSIYIAGSKFNWPGTPLKDITQQPIRFNEKIAAGFMANCWQPPEMV